MTYLPSDLINNDYLYTISNNDIIIVKNCVDNNCSCNSVYTDLDYFISSDYSCSLNSFSYVVDSSHFTDSVYYRKDLSDILIIFIIFFFICIFIPLKIFFSFFRKGWL